MVKDSENFPRLFLSEVNNDFVPEKDYVLGPWCFAGREKEFADWHLIAFRDAFDHPTEKRHAVEATSKFISFLVSEFSSDLNRQHARKYPFEYWWILLVRWLLVLIPGLWRRWVNIEMITHHLRYQKISVKIDSLGLKPVMEFRDTQNFIFYGLTTHRFDFWVNSIFVSELAPSSWDIERIEVPKGTQVMPNTISLGKTNYFKHKIRNALGHMPFSYVPGAGSISSLLMSAYINTLRPKTELTGFYGHRNYSPPGYFPERFVTLTKKISRLVIPSSFASDFLEFETRAKKNSFKTGRIFVTGAATVSDKNNYEAAHAYINGERLIRCQHGSDYGTMENTIQEALPEYMYTAFLTWGWEVEKSFDGNFIPTPAPLLSKYRNKYKKKCNEIILVGSKMWVFPSRIDQSPEPSYAIEYRKNKIELVASLNQTVRRQLIYRPYARGSTEFEDEQYFKSIFPEIPILKKDLHKSMARCNLIIVDHPGTTVHFALAMGVPTLMFWPENIWPVSKHAQPYFNSLYNAGIIHYTPQALAKKVNEIFDDPLEWWQQPLVKSARQEWANQFAATSRAWLIDWIKILRKI